LGEKTIGISNKQQRFQKMAPIFLLTETSAGYALFKAKDKKLLKEDAFTPEESTAEGVCSM